MKKIDWYILKKMLTTFVFVVVGLLFIICVIDFTEKNDNFLRHQVPGSLIFKYYMAFIPYFGVLLTPITAFIATVFITAKMASRTEIIAILASGISFRRMMLPYFIGAILIGAGSFYLINYIIPPSNKFRIAFEMEYIDKQFYYSERNNHFKIGENAYIYIDRYNNQRDIGYDVSLEMIVEEELHEKINARRMYWDTVSNKWSLRDWQKRVILPEKEVITEGKNLDTLLALSPSDFQNQKDLQKTLTLPELDDYINLQQSRGADDVMIYKTEKYVRFMQPFTVIILCFIGLIVSAKKSRRGTGFQIALGFVIAFAFIIFFVLASALAESGSIEPPFLAVWFPNIVFSLIGLLLYKTIPR